MKIKVLVVLAVFAVGAAVTTPMSVQVRNGKVRERPSQLGRVVAPVQYGDVVQVGTPQRKWYPVTTTDGKQGWLHESALTKKRIAMRAGTSDVETGVSSDEIALAGKGFNEQVEAKLRAEGTLDYTWVDKMMAFQVSADQILEFLAQGHLKGGDL